MTATLPVRITLIETHNPGRKSYLDLVMDREVVDAELCKHVQQLRQRHFLLDDEVLDSLAEAQDREQRRFLLEKERFHNSLPTIQAGDYVFLRSGDHPSRYEPLLMGPLKWCPSTRTLCPRCSLTGGLPGPLPDQEAGPGQGLQLGDGACKQGSSYPLCGTQQTLNTALLRQYFHLSS